MSEEVHVGIGWTIETLKLFMEEKFQAERNVVDGNDRRYMEHFQGQQEAVNAALDAAKQAVDKAELATEKRFDAVNEFRAQLADQAARLMPRAETELQFSTLVSRISAIERAVATQSGSAAGVSSLLGWILGAAGTIAAIVTVLVTHH